MGEQELPISAAMAQAESKEQEERESKPTLSAEESWAAGVPRAKAQAMRMTSPALSGPRASCSTASPGAPAGLVSPPGPPSIHTAKLRESLSGFTLDH